MSPVETFIKKSVTGHSSGSKAQTLVDETQIGMRDMFLTFGFFKANLVLTVLQER
jgi:hypothetical protein